MADEQATQTGVAQAGAAEQAGEAGMVTGGGIRMADRRIHLEPHAIMGKNEPMKKLFTRPWGSQPMGANLKTGALTGHPHNERKFHYKDEGPAAPAAGVPTDDIEGKQAYGR